MKFELPQVIFSKIFRAVVECEYYFLLAAKESNQRKPRPLRYILYRATGGLAVIRDGRVFVNAKFFRRTQHEV